MNKDICGETQFRVRYAETDQMGVVYHSNFVIWFEIGRVELLRQLGFHYRDMEEQDKCHLPVSDLKVRFKSPALYDDEIVVCTRLTNVRSSLLRFRYEVLRANNRELLAEGETTHFIVDDKFKITRLPQKYLTAFGQASAE